MRLARIARTAFFSSCTRMVRVVRHAQVARYARAVFAAALFVLALVALFSGHITEGASLAAVLTAAELNEVLEQIFNTADAAGESKGEMRAALDSIVDLSDPDSTLVKEGDEWVVEDPADAGDEDEDLEDE